MTRLLDVFDDADIFEDGIDVIKITKKYQNNIENFIKDLDYLKNIKKFSASIEGKHVFDKEIQKRFDDDIAIRKNLSAYPNHENLKVVAWVSKDYLQQEYDTKGNIFVNLESFLRQINNSIFESIKPTGECNKKVNIKLLNSEDEYESDYLVINNIRDETKSKTLNENTEKEIYFFANKGIEIVKLPSVFLFYNGNKNINAKNILESFTNNIADEQDKDDDYVIKGLKIITIKNKSVNFEGNLDHAVKTLHELWMFLIDDNRYDDKLKFVKESLAVHLPQESDFNDILKIVDTVKEYVEKSFKNYVQNSVTLFVEQESKLMSTFDETSQKIYTLIEDLTKRLREVLVGFVGIFLITFIDKNHDILSKSIINISLLAYSIYSLFILFVVINYGLQKKNLRKNLGRYEEKVNNLLPLQMLNEYQKNYISSASKQFTAIFVFSLISISLSFIVFLWTYLAHRFGIETIIIDIIKWLAYKQ